jgi:hypothetical protein
MPEPKTDLQRIDAAFEQARHELDGIASLRSEVEQRIAGVSIQPASRVMIRSLAACLALLILGGLSWRLRGVSSPPPHSLEAKSVAISPSEVSFEIGDTELIEQIAAIIDHRAVAVIWSFRGKGLMLCPESVTEHRAGKYRRYTLRQSTLPDGRTLVCTLFIPDEGVQPVLEPPSLCTRAADDRIFALGASPRAASRQELAAVIESAGFDASSRIGVDDILREIQKQPQ